MNLTYNKGRVAFEDEQEYWMVGGDGAEYGPASREAMAAWILEGRVDPATKIRAGDAESWLPASEFPEFAGALKEQRALFGLPPATKQEPGLGLDNVLGEAWGLFMRHFMEITSAVFIVWLTLSLLSFLDIAGRILLLAFSGPIYGSLYYFTLCLIREGDASPGRMLWAAKSFLPRLMTVGMLQQIATSAGYLLLIIPGIYLQVSWCFALFLVVDKGLEPWAALEASRKAVAKQWFRMAMILGIAFLPVVGITVYSDAVTGWELSKLVSKEGMEVLKLGAESPDMKRIAEMAAQLSMIRQLLLLFTLPYAAIALSLAYERRHNPSAPGR